MPVGGASEMGGMNETGVVLSQEPGRDIFMIAEDSADRGVRPRPAGFSVVMKPDGPEARRRSGL